MRAILLCCFLIIFIGCNTQQSGGSSLATLLDSRVGTFTYSEMVELNGPPDSKEVLPNGSTVGVWVIVRTTPVPSTTLYNSNPLLRYHTTYGGGMQQITHKIVLTFDGGGVLRNWRYNRY